MELPKSYEKNSKKASIDIRGAKEHNLKNFDLQIPRHSITAVTGVSGSGKSSLVFDTVLAEANRRFFYTLSHYSRQFLDIGSKPNVLSIEGLSPAIGLAQNETQASRRASVATLTDLAELTAIIFANHGTRSCPKHHLPTTSLTIEQIAQSVFKKYQGKLIALIAPVAEKKKGQFKAKLESFNEKGFLRVFINGRVVPLNPLPQLAKEEKNTIKLLADYVRIQEKNKARLIRSIEIGLEHGLGIIECCEADSQGQIMIESLFRYSLVGGCPQCQFSWPKLDSRYFSSNSIGRCLHCNGLGEIKSDENIQDQPDENDLPEIYIPVFCKKCSGAGILDEYRAIKIQDKSIHDLYQLTLQELLNFWQLEIDDDLQSNPAFKRVVDEIITKLKRLNNIGLSYLSLARRIRSLSGGELQRLKLGGILAERLRGVLYILDEPSQGLHPHEINMLVSILKSLKQLGNTILLVDHDEDLIRQADWIVDMGPEGGAKGGYVTAQFSPDTISAPLVNSKTAELLLRTFSSIEKKAFQHSHEFIKFFNIERFNLSIPEVKVLKKAINVVSGVSGSGKSTLVHAVIYRSLKHLIDNKTQSESDNFKKIFFCSEIRGFEQIDSIHLVDRTPIAKNSVSMPATYLDVFTSIRQIYEKLPTSQMLGLKSRDYSLRVTGGRCEECKGMGEVTLSMKFLADARVKCQSCLGKRYKSHVLNITYQGHSLADVLQLTINQAAELFKNHKKIINKLKPAQELGLGYLRLGQTSLSLSGGESQRLKLVPFFAKKIGVGSLFILDEPTQGLHFADIKLLIKALESLVNQGATIVMIEHCYEVLSRSDWNIDLGPGSGPMGGTLVYQGLSDEFLQNTHSKTAESLRRWMQIHQPRH